MVSTIIIAATIFGCGRRSASVDRLDLAESLIWSVPDSALYVLETVSPDSLAKGEERARYALLLTMAMDKNYLKPTNDSLISSAVDHYSSKNNAGCLMVANYYRGRVQQHNGRYPQALLSFYQAKELAEKNDSSFWAGMACRGISDIYLETYNRTEELTFAQREYEYLKRSGRQPYLNYALLDLGRAHANNGHNHCAIAISEEVSDSAQVVEDPYLLYVAQQLKGNVLINDKKYSLAFPIFAKICEGEFAETIDSLNLCRVLAQKGLYEETMALLNQISDTEPGMKELVRHVVYRSTGQLEKAMWEGDCLDSVTGNIFRESLSYNIAGTLSDYFEINKRISDMELYTSRIRTWLLAAIFIIVLIVIAFTVTWIYRRQCREIDRKVLFAEQLQQQLAKNTSSLDSLRESLDLSARDLGATREELGRTKERGRKAEEELYKTRKDLDKTEHTLCKTKEELDNVRMDLDRSNTENMNALGIIRVLRSARYELLEQLAEIVRHNETKVARRKIADMVTTLIEDFSDNGKKIDELGRSVDSLHDNLWSDIRRDMPGLKEADYRLFLFSVLQLSSDTIALFLREDNVSAVYNRKKRLKDKIRRLEPDKADRYLRCL
ncbi:MAG: hypothetical protein HDR88_04660 [Bacteroides sp.]|nr:hypothetical protein [Bacteroides sp.]